MHSLFRFASAAVVAVVAVIAEAHEPIIRPALARHARLASAAHIHDSASRIWPMSWVLLLLVASVPSVVRAAGDVVVGKVAFTPCASCHHIGPNARAGFGPQLNGIVGRMAGSTADFAYSDAMKASKIRWSEETLTAFIKNQDRVVPGTKMRFSSFGYDDRKIADLLAYLRSFPADGPN